MLQKLIPSFPWIAPPRPPPWHNSRKGRDQILPSGNFADCRLRVAAVAAAQPPRKEEFSAKQMLARATDSEEFYIGCGDNPVLVCLSFEAQCI